MLVDEQTCSVCFKKDTKAIVQCPNCETKSHKVCWALWAKTSNIGIFNLFRCHNCFRLLRFDEEFVYNVHTGKIQAVEEIKIEVMDLQDFEESLELDEGPKIIQVEDPLAMLDEDDIKIVYDDD